MTINSNSPLDSRLEYIQLRRRGVDFTPIIQREAKRQLNRLQETANQLAESLQDRQSEACGILDEFETALQSHEFLEPAAFQNENLKCTAEKLTEVQLTLKGQLADAEMEMAAKLAKRRELELQVEELRNKLNSSSGKYFPYQEEVYDLGARFNQYLSNQKYN